VDGGGEALPHLTLEKRRMQVLEAVRFMEMMELPRGTLALVSAVLVRRILVTQAHVSVYLY